MRNKMKATAFVVVCLSAGMSQAEYGPLANDEDQFRFLWGATDRIVDDLSRGGFNTVIDYSVGYWDMRNDMPKPDIARRVAVRKDRLDRYLRLGLGSVIQLRYSHNSGIPLDRYRRVRKDGTLARQVDAANAEFVEIGRHAIREEARTLDGHPAVVGVQTASEIRDSSEPSYTPEMRAAYRAFSGRDVPAEAEGRNPPAWKTRKGFPAERIVDDDDPLLDFYRWTWKHGDGWNAYQTMAADEFNKAFGRPVLSMYDPSIRTPPFWGNGGKVTHLNHWTYTYPEPYNVSYNISQQKSMARGGGQAVAHLKGRLFGEGAKNKFFWGDLILKQKVQRPQNNAVGFARAGTGNRQQGPRVVGDNLALGRVQIRIVFEDGRRNRHKRPAFRKLKTSSGETIR